MIWRTATFKPYVPRCERCNKYMPDRCTCNGLSIEEKRMTAHTLEAERAAPELLPCPMCGCADIQFSSPGAPDESSYDFVICNGCGISAGRADCDGDLHEVWNRRIAAPVAEGVALPPLPEPVAFCAPDSTGNPLFGKGWMFGPVAVAQAQMPLYTAEQVRQAQREAYELGKRATKETA